MANKKITELTELTSPAGADLFAIVDDTDTTTKKVTVTNLMGQAPVQSVNTATGAVVLDADDIDDASTTNKFVTAADITNLGNLSGTNTGDQDLSSYLQSVSAGDLTDGNFDGEAILGFKASLPTEITAATYTVQDSDNGQVIRVNHATGCTVTIPSGLFTTDSTGFNCSFIQVGAGQITFANDGTSVINNRQSHTKTNAQWAAASVVSTANNVFVLAGDTAS
jgi:hypothetical protein